MRDIRQTFSLDAERANSPFPSEMLAAIKEARREKIRNKRRERLREKSGEVLKCTLARQRQGPPPHLLCKMSKKQRYLDNVARSVSEVGYVGFVKTIIGRKLKNKELWKTLEETWQLTERTWQQPSWGSTFGAPCMIITTKEGGKRIPEAKSL